jgi:gliding motility-associated-like protein
LTVTDVNGCFTSQTVNISQPSMALQVSAYEVQPVLCHAGNSGFIDIYAIGGTLPYTFSWSNGATTEDISGLNAGVYTVLVTDANNCTASLTQIISQPVQALSAAATSVGAASCFGSANGSVNLTVTGGTMPYIYEWSNGVITEDISGLTAGTYSVTVTDANGCTSALSVIITQPAAALTSTPSVSQQVSCFGGANGAISLAVAGGTAPYTYLWSNGAVTSGISNLAAGVYTVTVTDINSCSVTSSVTVSQPNASLNGVVSSVHAALCFGYSTGSVAIQVSGGTAPYSYVWSNGATTQNISGVGAGMYTVTVTDFNGCTFSLNQVVGQPAAALSASAVQTQSVACFAGNSGAASATASGGTAPYTFVWNTGDITQNITGLAAGLYTVTITDNNGCSSIASVTITQPAAALSVVVSSTQSVSCFGGNNGSASAAVAGGTAPYSFQWSNGSATQSANGLSAGIYTVTVTDSRGCITSGQVTITQPAAALSVSASMVQAVSCFGGNNGSLNISVSGGTPSYSYTWNIGSTSQNINSLVSGTYTVTVTDIKGCTASISATVGQPNAALNATTVVAANISCFSGNNGAIDLTVSGGTAPYSFLWNTGAVTEDISSVSAGNYSVTITDANGCTFIAAAQITQPAGALAATLSSLQSVSCYSGSNGSLNLVVNGGTQPYSYIWNTGATSQNISGLQSGSYTVTITDINGCNVMQSGVVTQPSAAIAISATGVSPVLCNGGNTGAIDISVTGGTVPYSYSWSNGSSNEDISNLVAGVYSVLVSDLNGCIDSLSISVSEPANALSGIVTASQPVSCFGGNNGSLDVTVSGGTQQYSFLWSNGEQTEDIFNLASGTYTLTVTDANSCVFTMSASVSQPAAPLNAALLVTSQVSCFAGEDGAIDLTVSGGTGPYTFVWSNGATTEDINQLMAGVYYVTVTDANGCVTSGAEEIFEPVLPLTGTPTITANVFCNGGANGAIDLSVYGGTAPYTFMWSNGATTEDISGLQVGVYTVIITDANGCSTSNSAGIGQPSQQLSASLLIQHVLCFNGTNGAIDVTAMGGTAPYTYVWSTGSILEDIGGLIAGTYSVTITDANGCDTMLVAVVEQPQAPLIPSVTLGQDVSCNGGNDGSLNLSVTGGTPPYLYLWSNGSVTQNAGNLAAGMYTVTVTDANGCNAIISNSVSEPGGLIAVTSVLQQVSCFGGSNGSASVAVSGGTAPYSYMWSTGSASNMINGLSAGTYIVTATDSKGCVITASVTVSEPATAVSVSGSTTVANCLYSIGGTATAAGSGGTPPYSYVWNTGATTASISDAMPGSYTVTVTDANGCTASTVLVVGNASPVVINPGPTTICIGETTTLGVNSIPGATYQWYYAGVLLNGATGNTFETQAQGYYFVVVTSPCGTFYSDSVSVMVSSITNASISNDQVICPPDYAQLNATGGTSYQWSPAAGLNYTDIPNPIASPDITTLYTVTVTNDFGCTMSMEVEIVVDCDKLFVPNGFSPNNDGINDGYVVDGILNYPNNRFWVYNRRGNLVYKNEGYANQWDGLCNVQGIYWGKKVPSGTYFFILDLGDEKEKTRSGYLIIRR